ncbi:DegT/DnrJ/EryC1/StrS family aminotransferase [Desulfobacter vibrioformis]|uniref:DegT/DnrJ/EryC1/StrS family aminotransferase n=1 Tax=Desulfobacter vibrioformis TaxID=34031 RepID=UPI00146FEE5B
MFVERFEHEFAAIRKTQNVLGVCNGTVALYLVMFVLGTRYALFLSFVPKKREKNLRFLRITYSQPSLV